MIGRIGKFAKDTVGKSTGFRSEYQKQPPGTEHGPERFWSSFWKQRHLIILRCCICQEIVKIIPDWQLNFFPIIKSGSFHLTTFKRKTQGSDEMQEGTRGQAGTTDIAGIPVDFRRNQDNVTLQGVGIDMPKVSTQLCYNKNAVRF